MIGGAIFRALLRERARADRAEARLAAALSAVENRAHDVNRAYGAEMRRSRGRYTSEANHLSGEAAALASAGRMMRRTCNG